MVYDCFVEYEYIVKRPLYSGLFFVLFLFKGFVYMFHVEHVFFGVCLERILR